VLITVAEDDTAIASVNNVLTLNVVPLSNSPPPLNATSLSVPIDLVVFSPPLPNFKVALIEPETDISPA
jgi:hypothetical protein